MESLSSRVKRSLWVLFVGSISAPVGIFLYAHYSAEIFNLIMKMTATACGGYSAIFWLKSARNENLKLVNSLAAALSGASVLFGAISLEDNGFSITNILSAIALVFCYSILVCVATAATFPKMRRFILG